MLIMPNDGSPYASILSIDPGTETLGIACVEFDVERLVIHGSEAKTFKGSKLAVEWVEELHGGRFSRIHGHCRNLTRILNVVDPAYIACESPFFSRAHPQAYGALTEIVYALRLAVFEHNPLLEIQYIDPPSVKNAVGAKGNADKFAVRDCVLRLADLNYAGKIPLAALDEHSIDSLAVGYAYFQMIVALMKAGWHRG
ncbi:MAG: crossover junction endodeoxyribonuclease RuvC [Sulfuriferula sp.]|nr:crossover junction endodeoxyribonuclease RuvC [Sulfuriferula sp.]